jgi:hypothetical protein
MPKKERKKERNPNKRHRTYAIEDIIIKHQDIYSKNYQK